MTEETLDFNSGRPEVKAPPPDYKPTAHAANFVLVKIAVGKEDTAYEALKSIEDISGIHQVFGEWDLVLIVREKRARRFRELVLKEIRGVEGVIDTNTLIAAD